jgi:hypothetical protein
MIGADSDVSIKLVGGDNAQFQAITDKFYAQTVEELVAQGIQVVPHEELAALPEFAELAQAPSLPCPASRTPRPARDSSSRPRACRCT